MTSLASRTHFKVLGLILEAQVLDFDLKAYKSSKMPCPRLEESITFRFVETETNRT